MLVLPNRSRVGQSRFNFQLLRSYVSGMGKRVTVVCDDPAVQKMASETGFPVFGAVGPQGELIPSEAEPPPPPRPWWSRKAKDLQLHVGVTAPTKLITKSATELKPGRFLLYVAALMTLLVGLAALAVFVPTASVTLIAQAQPFSQQDVEIQAEPGKAPIRVRTDVISRTDSQGFKTTGVNQVILAQSYGQVTYTNNCSKSGHTSPGILVYSGQRLINSNKIEFAQTSGDVTVPWGQSLSGVSIKAIVPGAAGNIGSHTISGSRAIQNNSFDPCFTVDNPQATGGGADASSTPAMTVSDFDAARAQLEQSLHQEIAQQLAAALQPGEKLSETIVYGAPAFNTDHRPGDSVPSFSGTMTVQGEGDFYVDADVAKAFTQYLEQRVPNDQQLLIESGVKVSYRILSATPGGHLTFIGNSTAYVAPKLDQSKILSQIVGRPLQSAKFYLQTLPIKSSNVTEKPFPLPLMPLLVRRITLHYIVEPGLAQGATSSS
jgi:hypothetical protein